jgi:hypothetical protein
MPGRPPGVKGKKSPRRQSSARGGLRCTARLAVMEKAPVADVSPGAKDARPGG